MKELSTEFLSKACHATLWEKGNIIDFQGNDASTFQKDVHKKVRKKILSNSFPCVGAKAAFKKSAYAVGVYSKMNDAEGTSQLQEDLTTFFKFSDPAQSRSKELFITYLAVFTDEAVESELDFHEKLWAQLQNLHNEDSKHFDWDPRVDSDIQSENFSYSLGSTAFFVVGMNPFSSRLSRQFKWPSLVFNAGPQFEKIREMGIHDGMKETIRTRDINLQGSINPTLADFGHGNVALTYSGMNTSDISKCPFHARLKPD